MINVNEILKRNCIGESFGIKIKKTKGFGESYKKVTRAKSNAISAETKAIKNGINEVVRDQITAKGESTNIKIEENVEVKSYKEYKKELGLIPIGKSKVIKH